MPIKKHKLRLLGRHEYVDFPNLNLMGMEAKIDTGAYTSSLHCESIELKTENGQNVLYFTLEQDQHLPHRFEDYEVRKIKNSFGEMEERFVIKTPVHIGHRTILSSISLSNRDNMKYPVLIGRRILKGRFLIDVNAVHSGGVPLKRLKHLFF
ncbi:MAG TPA: RimK/LysX family protein [Bacteroidia bacterium]|nr:RimK/LysX family protein [Bacteroidia bacterium]